MPNEKEIRKIMGKVERVASGEKEPAKEKPELGAKKGPPVEKKQPLAISPEKEKPKAEVPLEDPEKVALRESVKTLGERMGKLEETLGQFIAQATARNTSQETDQKQEPKRATQEDPTPEEELAMLRDAQATQGEGQPGGGGTPAPPSNTMQMWLIGKVLDSVGKVLPAALQRGGGSEGSQGTSFSKLAEELLIGQIKRQITGGGGDQNISLEHMKTLAGFQGMLLGNFFNTVKNLPKPMAEKIIEGAIRTPGATEEKLE